MTLRLRRRAAPRGFSLIEAMVAGTVLILGLTGTTALLTRGAVNARNGQQMIDSANLANEVLAGFTAEGATSMLPSPPGVSFDAGTALSAGTWHDASGRAYAISYIVSDVSPPSPPALLFVPTFQVEVEVSYRDGVGRTNVVHAQTTLSEVPDAGL